MFLNLESLRTELTNRLKSNSAVLSDARLNQWLNQAQDDVANELDFNHLLHSTTLETVAGVRQYYAPNIAQRKIRSVVNADTMVPLEEISKASLLVRDPDEGDTGSPYFYACEGAGYIRSAHTSGTVDVASSSASDTTQKVRIYGRIANQVDATELISLNGVTVQTGTITFEEVYSATTDGTTVGRITVNMNDTNNTVIARIAPWLRVDETAAFYVYPSPTAAETLNVIGYRRPRQMVNDEDFPDFPTSYHELVLLGALIRGHKDLFRFNLANDVFKTEFLPQLNKLRKEQNLRSRKSKTLVGMFKDDIIPSSNYPSNFGV